MHTNVEIDEKLLDAAMVATGLPKAATIEKALRNLVPEHEGRHAITELAGIGSEGKLDNFENVAILGGPMAKLNLQVFEEDEGRGAVAINPKQVRRLKASGSSSTSIFFDRDDFIDVCGSLEDVMRRLCVATDEVDDEIPY